MTKETATVGNDGTMIRLNSGRMFTAWRFVLVSPSALEKLVLSFPAYFSSLDTCINHIEEGAGKMVGHVQMKAAMDELDGRVADDAERRSQLRSGECS